jgi:hypothetical protein
VGSSIAEFAGRFPIVLDRRDTCQRSMCVPSTNSFQAFGGTNATRPRLPALIRLKRGMRI